MLGRPAVIGGSCWLEARPETLDLRPLRAHDYLRVPRAAFALG